MKTDNLPLSFRDPSGNIFLYQKKITRKINIIYKHNYDYLLRSGLYKELINKDLLISHKELPNKLQRNTVYKIIRPETIPFISYPYELCFGELKDAALSTLKIQKIALSFGMSLKDANAFNIQFLRGKPVLIDTLSFEIYQEGKPWTPYRQFCQHFLAPLALASYIDIRLKSLFQTHIDGIPLDLASKLLPFSARLNPSLFIHLFLHSKLYNNQDAKQVAKKREKGFKKNSLLGLIDSLESGIKSLTHKTDKTLWSHYYKESASYDRQSFNLKKETVGMYLDILHPDSILDIGANIGVFSRIASKKGIFTLSIDSDPQVVEENYKIVKENHETNILPLFVDITNPTPSLGWVNNERISFFSRPIPHTIMALALIHHLAIGNNLPLSMLSSFFSQNCQSLIIEFVPKNDKKVQILLQNREDIFGDYNEYSFEKEFNKFFSIKNKTRISSSGRTLYLMIKKK